MNILLLLVLGYLVGSLPIAYLVARAWGANVFEVGTRNPGAANVFRSVGRTAGIVVLVGDLAKAAAPVLVARWLHEPSWLALATGLAAMIGHWYPVFLRFRGGAGLATTIGVGYAILPVPALLATIPGIVVLSLLHNTGIAAGVGFLVFFVVALIMHQPILLALAISVLPALALARERLLPTPGARRKQGQT